MKSTDVVKVRSFQGENHNSLLQRKKRCEGFYLMISFDSESWSKGPFDPGFAQLKFDIESTSFFFCYIWYNYIFLLYIWMS